ncbi:M23 family metallopeptidase [Azospirillum sp. ST 5-10]|uniref:M23 family metallopeptidase n=1 Tax=unclassified Azospirillum TaxID=2630922 RepID=UPI003F4A20D4
MIGLVFAAAVLIAAAPAHGAEADGALAHGRALTQWSSPDSMERLASAAAPELADIIRGLGGTAGLSRSVAAQLGDELRVLDEGAVTLNGLTTYRRLAAHARAPAVLTSAAWTADGAVQAASVRPAPVAAAPPGPAPATALALPLPRPPQGSWFTVWGGRSVARNYHIVAPDQRYAYDFVVARDGRTFEGPADRPESYFCWGLPVLAPAAGEVVAVVDGIPDNVPVGAMNPRQPPGNHVIVRHRPGEYSLIAHLRAGSVAVRAGQQVAAGAPVGACGNSGNSSEPHVHYHLQSTGTFGGDAQGLPAVFEEAVVDGRRVAAAVPERGQTVAPVP